MKQVQPFKGFGSFDVGGEFIHGFNTVVNKIAFDNGWQVLPVSIALIVAGFELRKSLALPTFDTWFPSMDIILCYSQCCY